jgi:hypothetical protein
MRRGLILRSTYRASWRRRKRLSASIDCVERNDNPTQHNKSPITDIRTQTAVPMNHATMVIDEIRISESTADRFIADDSGPRATTQFTELDHIRKLRIVIR